MENILEEIGMKVLVNDNYEADDLAGSMAKKFEDEVDVILMTKDHDYYQLVNEKTKVWMGIHSIKALHEMLDKYNIDESALNIPYRYLEITPEIVKGETGVYPHQIPDLKGFLGDASDNIPGVKGISSAAAPLLSLYKTVEGVYAAIEAIGYSKDNINTVLDYWKTCGIKRSPIKALTRPGTGNERGAKDYALLSKQLGTIVTDIPLNIKLNDVKLNINQKSLSAVKKKYEIKLF